MLSATINFKKQRLSITAAGLLLSLLLILGFLIGGEGQRNADSPEKRKGLLSEYGITVDTAKEQCVKMLLPSGDDPALKSYAALQGAEGDSFLKFAEREVLRYTYPLENSTVGIFVYNGSMIAADIYDNTLCRYSGLEEKEWKKSE